MLAGIVGDEHVSTGGGANKTGEGATCVDADAVAVVSPATFEETCEVLRAAAREGWKVEPAGAGVWLDAGNPVRGGRVVVKTARMARVVAHEPADLVATAEAGVTLADFNREAGRAGQWLPLDPPGGARATLGGVAATGTGGAQSFSYGTPRSYVLGLRAALADGRLVSAGGRVVKNVAGYDLCKLFVGSHGTLGLILELTIKLRPRPAREATLAATSADLPRLVEAARSLVASQLFPAAVEIVSPRMTDALSLPFGGGGFVLLARLAGTEGAVAYQVARAREIVGGREKITGVEMLDEDGPAWSGLAAASAGDGHGLTWRASVLPSELGAMLGRLREECGDEAQWHAGAGDGRVRVFEAARGDAETISSLRRLREAARRAGGSLVVERAPEALRREFDAWGLSNSAASLMRRVKAQLDPSDTFSPGRFALNES